MNELAESTTTILDAIKPFEPDDNQKGTFLVLRISGADNRTALRLINRKYRSWQNWRSVDEDFYRLDEQVPELQKRFGVEAKLLRTSMLDISIIEAGIVVFGKIIDGRAVNSDMWAYATKLAGLRVPLMVAKESGESPWAKLASSIQHTLAHREMTVREIGADGTEKSITAKEITVGQSAEQKLLADEIVGQYITKEE